MKIAIVGWGVEGQSAYRYFGPEHDYLIVSEEPRDDFPAESDKIKLQYLKTPKPPGITSNVSDLSYLDGIDECDKIIYSVTAAKNLEKKFGEDEDFWRKAVTVQHIFFEEVKTKNIIGVTGSKGKGTTATLIHEMLKASGLRAHLAGNIGVSVLDVLPEVQVGDWVILEVTNFQLYRFPYSPHVAVCLRITEEHQDWHESTEEYVAAKTNLFSHQKEDDLAIYMAGNERSEQIAGASPGKKIPYFAPPGALAKDEGTIVIGDPETEIIKTEDIELIGGHNLENVCAAATVVWQIVPNLPAIQSVLKNFSGLEHRLEFVRELDEVEYYDDSFGTTPDTAIVAMKAFVNPKVMILGGHDKGLSLDNLIDEIITQRVRHVIAIGDIGPRIADLLKEENYSNTKLGLQTMPEIVAEARKAAQPGDVVLLSCGTSSFGQFEDYEDRGDQFKEAVLKLV